MWYTLCVCFQQHFIFFYVFIHNITERNVKMDITKNVTVIIPSLNPDEKLCKVVSGLENMGFDDIIIVNDGSCAEKLCNFPNISEHPSCTILTHKVNRGKGAALKTAFAYFLERRNGKLGAVSVDGDNQHRPEDVLKCCDKMVETGALVLGVRDFSLPHVPKRSRMGNRITSFVFKVGCGLKISDTQTGLRAFPAEYIPDMLNISGDRFEYETNMLLNLKKYSIPLAEQTIETVYIEENQTSHFRPVRDSIRIYSLILKFVASSMISAALETVFFYLMMKFLGKYFGDASIVICTVTARIFSSLINFNINKNGVFKDDSQKLMKTFVKYYTVAIPVMLISAFSVTLITKILKITMPSLTTLIKAAVDIILFMCSFRLQREWVFCDKEGKKHR